ncbi:antitoxin MazE family protein [Bordetella sp. FB-8]|uniref:antitoxin MazE family protein n=1 Tax=Bordetella sp. FB-8 TaxID=1159870 RepID=UPI0009D9870A|nr:antitoxin MazE family protein [Bordetella sp. FB-8]
MSTTTVNARVQKHRASLRAAGLRPVQIWVPDTRRQEFAQECLRQSRAVALADASDTSLSDFMDDALASVEGWTE